MITPHEVVEKLSFSKSQRSRATLDPASEPPIAPPPPPPDSEAHDGSEEREPLVSYQHGTGRPAALPAIRHYDGTLDEEDESRPFFRGSHGFRGDASLRPNTGLTNVYDTAVFGLALHELLEMIRLTNLLAALFTIGLVATTWFFRAITLQVGRLVLSGYLVFFVMILAVHEVNNIWTLPYADDLLSDNFGLLYHPVGKIVFIYLIGTLCWGLTGFWEFLLGWVYFASASLLLYVWLSYPEYRRPFEEDDGETPSRHPRPKPSASWSCYSNPEQEGILNVFAFRRQRSAPS